MLFLCLRAALDPPLDLGALIAEQHLLQVAIARTLTSGFGALRAAVRQRHLVTLGAGQYATSGVMYVGTHADFPFSAGFAPTTRRSTVDHEGETGFSPLQRAWPGLGADRGCRLSGGTCWLLPERAVAVQRLRGADTTRARLRRRSVLPMLLRWQCPCGMR